MFFACMYFTINAQSTVSIEYKYDNQGNRYKRILVGESQESTSESADEEISEEESADDSEPQIEVQVYPNPTEGDLNILVSNASDDLNFTYSVVSLTGEVIKEGTFYGNGIHFISIVSATVGIYILTVDYDEYSLSYTIVKN